MATCTDVETWQAVPRLSTVIQFEAVVSRARKAATAKTSAAKAGADLRGEVLLALAQLRLARSRGGFGRRQGVFTALTMMYPILFRHRVRMRG